jgi:DNA polymerase III sliding clamp (beta) subunit (PCNA family)
MLKTLADALGSEEVVLEFGTSTSAILVTPKLQTPGTVGLIMPIRITPY